MVINHLLTGMILQVLTTGTGDRGHLHSLVTLSDRCFNEVDSWPWSVSGHLDWIMGDDE